MKVLSNELLKEIFNIKQLPPVLYVSPHSLEDIDNDILINNMENRISSMPFDDNIIVTNVDDAYLITRINLKQNLRKKESGDYFYKNTFIFNSVVNSYDSLESFKSFQNISDEIISGILLCIFKITDVKNTTFVKSTGPALKSKKNKLKKQNFIIVADKKTVKEETKSLNINPIEYLNSFLVSGHWRHYNKKDFTGFDRFGEPVSGKTWVRPYTKGEGKELMEKIRLFLK